MSTELVRRLGATMPLLGVCLGHQCIGAAYGGRHRSGPAADARQDLADPARRDRDFHRAPLAVHRDPVPLPGDRTRIAAAENSEAIAWSDEGEIMAVQHRRFPVTGVQFHPESVLTEYGYRMLDRFLTGGTGQDVPDRADRASVSPLATPPDLASAPPSVEFVR